MPRPALTLAYSRRQKDKRIASGGSASAGAAYRNPPSEGGAPGPREGDGPGPREGGEPGTGEPSTAPGAEDTPAKPNVKKCHKAKGDSWI